MAWSLFEKDGKVLEPLKFSNGKTQADVVDEVLRAIDRGEKIIFIKGVCGTGKSAIALNIARELGKASVVVPSKNLQSQYQKDYEEKKYLLNKNEKEKLKIKVMTGRGNHKCQFLIDNKDSVPVAKEEKNASLHDIFEGRREQVKKLIVVLQKRINQK